MVKLRVALSVTVVTCAIVGMSLAVSGQTPRSPATPGDDPLLAEIRGLRADLAGAMSAAVRAQVLVGRLQLQEQRISAIVAQLVEVRRQLMDEQNQQATLADRLQQTQEALDTGAVSAESVKDMEAEVRALKHEVSRVNPKLQQLRDQEADLSAQVVAEQGRWMDFNTRLDDIERALPTPGAVR